MQTDIQTHRTDLPSLLTQKQLADYTGKSEATLERARWAGEPPKFVKLGRHVRYRATDVLEWINSNIKTSSGGE